MKSVIIFLYFLIFLTCCNVHADEGRPFVDCNKNTKISKIVFITDINLGYNELISNLGINLGEVCELEKIYSAVEQLKKRNIFEKVLFHLEQNDLETTLVFELIPFLVLSQVEFSGNEATLSSELLRNSGLKIGNQIFAEDVRESERRIVKFYGDLGYPEIDIDSRLIADRTSPLVSLEFKISEGSPNTVKEISYSEEVDSNFVELKESISSTFIGEIINKSFVLELKRFVFQKFANLNYYQASVFVDIVDPKQGKILVKVSPKEPLKIQISGAVYFTEQDLLNKLELESRVVPLRIGGLSQWCEEIKSSYIAQGFLDAEVDCKLPKPSMSEAGGQAEAAKVILVQIKEGHRFETTKIEFLGNINFSTRKLESVINASLKIDLSDLINSKFMIFEREMPDLEQALRSFYVKEGYLDIQITPEFDQDDLNKQIIIKFKIDEGRRYYIREVDVDIGKSDLALEVEEDLSMDLKNEIDRVYRVDEVVNELLLFEKKVIANGYSDAKTYPEYFSDTEKLKVTINLGPKIKIRKILSGGNYFTLDRIILRELKFSEGDYLNSDLIDESRRALLGLGIFKSVEIFPIFDGLSPNECDIQVMVKERETGVVETLAELSTQDGLHLQGQLGQRNLFGSGRALVVSLDGYLKQNQENLFDAARARAAYGSPKLFGSFLDYQLEGFYQTSLNLNRTFKYDRVGASNTLKFPLLEVIGFSVGHTVYNEQLFDVDSDIIIGSRDVGTTTYSALKTSIEYDQRDDPFVATRGYRLEFGGSIFPSALGSEVPMTEGHFQITNLKPVGDFWTYATNLRGSMIRASGGFDNVPLGSRYFIGGRDTLRGYTRYQVGPRALSGDVAGGDTAVSLNQEMRYQISEQIVGLVFLDIGQSILIQANGFSGDTKNDFSSLRYSPGFGTQYLTPIGPLGFEIGFATNREFGERWGRVLISIGSAF